MYIAHAKRTDSQTIRADKTKEEALGRRGGVTIGQTMGGCPGRSALTDNSRHTAALVTLPRELGRPNVSVCGHFRVGNTLVIARLTFHILSPDANFCDLLKYEEWTYYLALFVSILTLCSSL